MQVLCILTISPLFPQQCKSSYSTARWLKSRKNIKSFLRSNEWLFFQSFLFILLRFKSHQTLYVSATLAGSFNTLLSCSICLWNFSCHIQHDLYFERWFYATLISEIISMQCYIVRNTSFNYWIGYLSVLPQCKSWNCQTRVINKARRV